MIWGGSSIAVPTWTPKVCRIIAFYRYWAILLTFEGLPRTLWLMKHAPTQKAKAQSNIGPEGEGRIRCRV